MASRHRPRTLTDDPTDQFRRGQARWSLMMACALDPRVIEARRVWLVQDETVRVVAGYCVAGDDWFAAANARCRAHEPDIAAALRPFAAPAWLAQYLAYLDLTRALHDCYGVTAVGPWRFPTTTPWASRTRRMPKAGLGHPGATIDRDVRWYYAVYVKQPPASVKALGRAYAAQEGRRTEAASVVRDGIARARVLLQVD